MCLAKTFFTHFTVQLNAFTSAHIRLHWIGLFCVLYHSHSSLALSPSPLFEDRNRRMSATAGVAVAMSDESVREMVSRLSIICHKLATHSNHHNTSQHHSNGGGSGGSGGGSGGMTREQLISAVTAALRRLPSTQNHSVDDPPRTQPNGRIMLRSKLIQSIRSQLMHSTHAPSSNTAVTNADVKVTTVAGVGGSGGKSDVNVAESFASTMNGMIASGELSTAVNEAAAIRTAHSAYRSNAATSAAPIKASGGGKVVSSKAHTTKHSPSANNAVNGGGGGGRRQSNSRSSLSRSANTTTNVMMLGGGNGGTTGDVMEADASLSQSQAMYEDMSTLAETLCHVSLSVRMEALNTVLALHPNDILSHADWYVTVGCVGVCIVAVLTCVL